MLVRYRTAPRPDHTVLYHRIENEYKRKIDAFTQGELRT